MLVEKIEFLQDEEGFLKNIYDWNESIAMNLAQNEGVNMNQAHWEIIHLVRNFYIHFNTVPNMRILVKMIADTHGVKKGNSRYLFSLFSKSPVKQISKIAGLPNPGICI
ncbi:MAG: TusE/DsrC/DsvC family sulfur relay protein [Candidatus Dasytiphilus stammeri]